MSGGKAFFDTNILLDLRSEDPHRADGAEAVVANGGVVRVHVLDAFAAFAARKLRMSWAEIHDALEPVRAVCKVGPLTAETHDLGLEIAERYGFFPVRRPDRGGGATSGMQDLVHGGHAGTSNHPGLSRHREPRSSSGELEWYRARLRADI